MQTAIGGDKPEKECFDQPFKLQTVADHQSCSCMCSWLPLLLSSGGRAEQELLEDPWPREDHVEALRSRWQNTPSQLGDKKRSLIVANTNCTGVSQYTCLD